VVGLIGAAVSYLSAPDVANAPADTSTPTYKSNGGYSIVAGAAGGVGAGKVAQAVTAAKIAEEVKSLKDQAADLIPQNANKNRVTLRSSSQKMDVDLAGRNHNDIPTPHTKISNRNFNSPNQPAYNTRNSQIRPTTQQDIRTVRRYLEHKRKK